MTDRELLERAAKAAGLQEWGWMADTLTHVVNNTFVFWDPLTDDGDALRLAVKLDMELLVSKPNDPRPWRSAVIRNTVIHGAENVHDDPYAATRRAIVRAAAEIGKGMP